MYFVWQDKNDDETCYRNRLESIGQLGTYSSKTEVTPWWVGSWTYRVEWASDHWWGRLDLLPLHIVASCCITAVRQDLWPTPFLRFGTLNRSYGTLLITGNFVPTFKVSFKGTLKVETRCLSHQLILLDFFKQDFAAEVINLQGFKELNNLPQVSGWTFRKKTCIETTVIT